METENTVLYSQVPDIGSYPEHTIFALRSILILFSLAQVFWSDISLKFSTKVLFVFPMYPIRTAYPANNIITIIILVLRFVSCCFSLWLVLSFTPVLKLENYPLSVVCGCYFDIYLQILFKSGRINPLKPSGNYKFHLH
jgi:hypothetical protein